MIKIHAMPRSPRGFKVLFAAHQIDVPYEFAPVGPGTTRTPEYTAINPNQRMPTLENGAFKLWESNAIVNYLAEQKPDSGYLPRDLETRMTAQQWQFWEANHWDPTCLVFVFERFVKQMLGMGDADPVELKKAEAQMARLGPVLDGQLAKTRYVTGDRITVADISLAPSLIMAEPVQMPVGEYRNIARWMTEMKALPAWTKTAAMANPG